MSIRFEMNWFGPALGSYRPTEYAEDGFPLDALPSVDPGHLTGEFDWLGPRGRMASERVAALREVTERLDQLGLSLPSDFGTYFTSEGLVAALHARTSCAGDLFGPIPSPVEAEAHLIRYFRDQQDCVEWYIYLRPG